MEGVVPQRDAGKTKSKEKRAKEGREGGRKEKGRELWGYYNLRSIS